jgi:hypothetical protein
LALLSGHKTSQGVSGHAGEISGCLGPVGKKARPRECIYRRVDPQRFSYLLAVVGAWACGLVKTHKFHRANLFISKKPAHEAAPGTCISDK